MRVVREPAALEGALEAAASEALKAFADASVYLEKYVERPRHIEIQVLADHLRTAHLGERECSVQRRHQKLVEEAPSVAVSRAPRADGARRSRRQRRWDTAGRDLRVLLAPDGAFYFLEMNTRIQVEHPVTELAYGVDLVREQLRIAAGEPCGSPRLAHPPRVGARVPHHQRGSGERFLPSTGRIEYLRPWRVRGPLGRRGRDRRRNHALLRLPARQDHRVGPRPR